MQVVSGHKGRGSLKMPSFQTELTYSDSGIGILGRVTVGMQEKEGWKR